MSRYIATVLETTGINTYIFGSNRLHEIIGAAYLVASSTNTWVVESLDKLSEDVKLPVSILNSERDTPDAKPYIENSQLAAELVYAGGGKTVILFADIKYARHFTRILSKRVLHEAPGLNIVVAHKQFDWTTERLPEVIDDLVQNELDRKKNEYIPSFPLLGLSVTADCESTGLVAVGSSDRFDSLKKESYLVSREIAAKLEAIEPANKELKKFFSNYREPKISYRFADNFDELSSTDGNESYIAVVRANGNGIGDRFNTYSRDLNNRDFITAMRRLSWSVTKAGENALKDVYSTILHFKEQSKKGQKSLSTDNWLPFRLLLYEGDNITFVCDGSWSLVLAALYLQFFEQQIVDEKPLTACAGVSVVKTIYPFAKAYALSEELCKNAKNFVRDEKRQKEADLSALDWHIAANGLCDSLNEIRRREYHVAEENLTRRPVRLHFLKGELKKCGWTDVFKTDSAECGYFDAIEAMEFYQSLG